MSAYYNELDPLKAATIRVAISAGAIAPGDVDERSIADIDPAELMGYTQCHFFAGGGFWSLALRLAGWPDDRPVWTGSCPCPSFSAAGKGEGFDDPRHLWPAWAKLIRVCHPPTIFGEQADDAIGFGWLDLVQTDLEAEAYAVGKAILGTASVGGADIRQRLYFVAQSQSDRRQYGATLAGSHAERDGSERKGLESGLERQPVFMANTASKRQSRGWIGDRSATPLEQSAEAIGSIGGRQVTEHNIAGVLGNASGAGLQERVCNRRIQRDSLGSSERQAAQCGSDIGRLAYPNSTDGERRSGGLSGAQAPSDAEWIGIDGSMPLRSKHGSQDVFTSPLNGPWRNADWLLCRDGKWRPVESGTFPLAHGDPARLGRLRLYGDAINVEVAKTFIESYLDSID